MSEREAFERIERQFTSGNSVSVDRASVRKEDWEAAKKYAARQAPASGEVEPVGYLMQSTYENQRDSLILCEEVEEGDRESDESNGWTYTPLYTNPPAKVPESDLIDHIDLMADEFKRIKALNPSPEIVDLCERALSVTEQNVPVLKRVEKLEKCISSLLWENSELKERLNATAPETEWVKLSEDQPREVDVDVKLNDGSIIRNCLAQSDGDFYWKGGGSEMFILEHTVFAWRSATPP